MSYEIADFDLYARARSLRLLLRLITQTERDEQLHEALLYALFMLRRPSMVEAS